MVVSPCIRRLQKILYLFMGRSAWRGGSQSTETAYFPSTTFFSTSVIFVGNEGGRGSVFSLNGASLRENPALPFALTAETRNTYQWPNSISLIVTSWRSTTSATWRHSCGMRRRL